MNIQLKSLLTLIVVLTIGLSNLQAQRTVIHAGTLIDGEANSARNEVSIIVENDKIVSIENGYTKAKKNDTVIDLKNKTVLPGFIDLHVHLESSSDPNRAMDRFRLNEADLAYQAMELAEATLMAGFTTVRDLGGSGINISMRNAINAGHFNGPRIITVGRTISTTGGHGDPTNGLKRELMGDPGPKDGIINGVDDARKAVRQRYKEGSDHIKVTATGGVLSVAKSGDAPLFFADELEAIVQTAKEYGMHVAAHAHGAEGMKRAVEAGVLTIDHGTNMTEEIMDLMIKKGTYFVPTISAGKWVAEKAKIEGYYHPLVTPKALEIGPRMQDTFSRAYKRGVKIAFGTDAGVFPHGINAKEFGYMVEAGMPEMEAIQSATITAATVLGMQDSIGSIKQGKIADLVAVDKNPLKDITTLEKVIFVMKEGVVYTN